MGELATGRRRKQPRSTHHGDHGLIAVGRDDHRIGGAGGRDGRVRLPIAAAHLPGPRHCGGDSGRAAAEGAEVGRNAGEWAAGMECPEGDLGLEQLTRSWSAGIFCLRQCIVGNIRSQAEADDSGHVASPAASRRPDRKSFWCSGFRKGVMLGTTTEVRARSRSTISRASSSRPRWA